MLAQFIYDNENWFYEKKISKFFQNFFQFFSVFWTPFTHKKIFLHFWAKNNLLLYTRRATCPFDPQKMLFRGSFYKVSLKWPPFYTQKVHSTLKEYRKLFLKEWSYWCPRGGNKKTVLASLLWKPWSDRSKKVLFVLPWMFKLHLNSSVSDVNDGAGYTKNTRRQDKTLSLAPLTGLQHHSLGQDFIWCKYVNTV